MSEAFRTQTNNHHTLFSRVQHDAIEPNRLLRAHPGMQAQIDIDSHNQIHKEVNIVPTLDFHNASRVVSLLKQNPLDAEDPLHSIDRYMWAVQESVKHPRNRELDRSLGALVIMAMELQRPIIQQGLSRATIIDLGRFANHKVIHMDEVA